MGQEIVYCSACGIRLRSVDFERGGAATRDGTAFCRDCALKAGIPAEPHAPSKSNRNSTSRIPVVNTTSTTRLPIPTPRRPMEAVPSSIPPGLIWGGVGLAAVALLLAALMLGGGSRRPAAPEPEVPRQAAAAAPPPRAPASAPHDPGPATSKPGSPSTEPADRAALERRVADAVARERFREAFDLLDAERKRHDSLEWTSAVQRLGREVDASVKKLYQDLQATMDAARRRGAEPEAQSAAARIAAWGLPGYPVVPVAPTAAAAVAVPPPAPATDAAPAPAAPAAPAAVSAKSLPIPFTPGSQKWTLLSASRASATSAARLTPLEDGSILVDGAPAERDRYSVVVQTDLKTITALRLEVLPDPSLPGSGPGRPENGNFVLTEFQVQLLTDPKSASGPTLAFERAAADHVQIGFPITYACDGNNDTGWAILPQMGRAHEAIFELRVPLSSSTPLTLQFILDHQSIYGWHTIGRFRLSASSVKGAASELLSRPPPPVDQGPVDIAIRRGVDWLLKSGTPGAEIKDRRTILTCDELVLLTLLHSGVPENEARFQQLLASVLAGPYTHTYTVATRAMVLEELDRVRYQSHIARCAQFLIDNQLSSGQWSYGDPTVAVDGIRVDTPAATASAPKAGVVLWNTPRPKPKVVQKIVVRPTRTPAGNGDFSNSQYAALGLRACVDAGIVIPKEVFVRAVQALTAAQLAPSTKDGTASLPSGRKPRGWCYDSPCGCPLHRPYGTVTSGAVGSLAIYDHLLGRDPKKDGALQDGLAWLQVNYAVDTVPGPIEWDKISKTTYLPYYLYALERAMILTGNERLGTRTWYADGTRVLLENQRADGSWYLDDWGRDTWDTCFALLFLKRSTRPLVASTDRFHPPDEEKK